MNLHPELDGRLAFTVRRNTGIDFYVSVEPDGVDPNREVLWGSKTHNGTTLDVFIHAGLEERTVTLYGPGAWMRMDAAVGDAAVLAGHLTR